jgi:hypothetical protein
MQPWHCIARHRLVINGAVKSSLASVAVCLT